MTHNPHPLAQRETASVVVDGVPVTYHSAGQDDGRRGDAQRPVLVMVHGSTGSTDSHYGFLFPMLGFRQRVVSVDLAQPLTDALSLAQLVAQVGAVIDVVRGQSGGRPVSLMGYSLGAVVAALTVGMRRSGILVALLALPLYVPVLVFGAGAVAASAQGLDASGALLWLAAGLLLSLLLAPLAAAAAIRIALT